MVVFILLNFLASDFQQKWYIPQGTSGSSGRVVIDDTDRDGNYEFFICRSGGSQKIYLYELHLPDTWEVDSFSYFWGPLVWDSGDFDLDGLHDLVIQTAVDNPPKTLISIAESPDSFSYPTQEVWRDTVDIGTVQPICVYDIDKDGIPEILQTGGEAGTNYYIDFSIYESIDDNTYAVKYFFESPETPTSTVAFGDFDSDSLIEFVMGTIDGQYSIFESPENDSYISLYVNIQLPTVNIKDCFSVSDADEDGKLEFVVKGFWVYGTIDAFIFEAIGDNTYEIIKTFTLPGGDYYGGYSDAGDVDGDSVPEIVLEARQNVFIIKADGNDSFYVWDTLPGHNSGSSIAIYDIDGNGLKEIVISGNDETRIYEYDPGGMEEARSRKPEARYGLQVSPNPFKDKLNIRYQIPKGVNSRQKSVVSMNIYDITGRFVKTLVNEPQEPGYYQERIDTERLANGVYFIVLKQGDRKVNKKFILVR